MSEVKKRRTSFRRLRRWVKDSSQNALEIARLGRLGPAYSAPFEVLDRGPVARLRRYPGASAGGPPLLLIPPLMLTAEIYDVAPEL